MNREYAAWIVQRSAPSYFASSLKISGFHLKLNTLLRTSQRRPFGLAGIAQAARLESAPYLDDGRGRDLWLHTLPLGSRMLGLRPMSKINAALAARAHIPTGRRFSYFSITIFQ